MTDRELDALVAEQIMWRDTAAHGTPCYSTDLAVAIQLFPVLRADGRSVALAHGDEGAVASVLANDKHHFACDPFPARALCVAALKAYGVEVPE
jgi:hypothetical protein